MNKLYTTNLAMKVTTECAQLFGANGLARDSAIARFMAVAKMLQLVDGTSEIQKIIIGRSLERRAMQDR
jgi:butyryl-CoA dehydrogenase